MWNQVFTPLYTKIVSSDCVCKILYKTSLPAFIWTRNLALRKSKCWSYTKSNQWFFLGKRICSCSYKSKSVLKTSSITLFFLKLLFVTIKIPLDKDHHGFDSEKKKKISDKSVKYQKYPTVSSSSVFLKPLYHYSWGV